MSPQVAVVMIATTVHLAGIGLAVQVATVSATPVLQGIRAVASRRVFVSVTLRTVPHVHLVMASDQLGQLVMASGHSVRPETVTDQRDLRETVTVRSVRPEMVTDRRDLRETVTVRSDHLAMVTDQPAVFAMTGDRVTNAVRAMIVVHAPADVLSVLAARAKAVLVRIARLGSSVLIANAIQIAPRAQ
jgi:hypothetical protein